MDASLKSEAERLADKIASQATRVEDLNGTSPFLQVILLPDPRRLGPRLPEIQGFASAEGPWLILSRQIDSNESDAILLVHHARIGGFLGRQV